MFFLLIVVLLVGLVIMFFNVYKSIYTSFDHFGWKEKSKPDNNAKITNMFSEKVHYGSSSVKAKLKTKVVFSDGFYFITYKTDYNTCGLFTYELYLSEELKEKIISSAIEQHNLAVDKFINNN